MFIRKSLIGTGASIASLVAGMALAAQPASSGATATTITLEPPVKPLAFVICAFEGDNSGQKCAVLGGPPTYTVPTNRTFVIEQVTGTCTISSSAAAVGSVELSVVTGGVQVGHLVLASKPEGIIPFAVSDDTRIYADPGSTIAVDVGGITEGAGGFCRLAFSGRLVR